MKEIEVKILDIDRKRVEAKLKALGAEKEFDGEMHAIFYDSPDGMIKAKGDVLRIRKEGDEVVLAYKEKVSKHGAKIMNEYETSVSNMEALRHILEHLGFQSFTETRKFRTEYILSGVKIVIDDYQDALSYIPVFLEIEAPDEAGISTVVEALGFDKKECTSWDTHDLVLHYGKTD
jgi:predicted adenylyl cyclase CyaB